jgi:hypothetical protein
MGERSGVDTPLVPNPKDDGMILGDFAGAASRHGNCLRERLTMNRELTTNTKECSVLR